MRFKAFSLLQESDTSTKNASKYPISTENKLPLWGKDMLYRDAKIDLQYCEQIGCRVRKENVKTLY